MEGLVLMSVIFLFYILDYFSSIQYLLNAYHKKNMKTVGFCKPMHPNKFKLKKQVKGNLALKRKMASTI